MEARWPSDGASDSGARGPGFEPHGRRVVSLSKTKLSKVLVNTQEAMAPFQHYWKMFTRTLNPKLTKSTKRNRNNRQVSFMFAI